MTNNTLDLIRDLHEQHPEKTRFNCPFCNGINSLSISSDSGFLQYHCFRASCGTKGKDRQSLSLSEIQNRRNNFKSNTNERNIISNNYSFTIPDYFTSPLNHPPALAYLENNHCLYAYTHDLADIRYDPKLDRVVFICKDEQGNICNATGRKLKYTQGDTKWYIYGRNGYPFCCGNSDVAILVEDAASACSVSSIAVGISILGTSLSFEYVSLIQKYKSIYLTLDKDALRKALKIHSWLKFYVDCEIRLLDDDLKKLNPEQIRKVLKL